MPVICPREAVVQRGTAVLVDCRHFQYSRTAVEFFFNGGTVWLPNEFWGVVSVGDRDCEACVNVAAVTVRNVHWDWKKITRNLDMARI